MLAIECLLELGKDAEGAKQVLFGLLVSLPVHSTGYLSVKSQVELFEFACCSVVDRMDVVLECMMSLMQQNLGKSLVCSVFGSCVSVLAVVCANASSILLNSKELVAKWLQVRTLALQILVKCLSEAGAKTVSLQLAMDGPICFMNDAEMVCSLCGEDLEVCGSSFVLFLCRLLEKELVCLRGASSVLLQGTFVLLFQMLASSAMDKEASSSLLHMLGSNRFSSASAVFGILKAAIEFDASNRMELAQFLLDVVQSNVEIGMSALRFPLTQDKGTFYTAMPMAPRALVFRSSLVPVLRALLFVYAKQSKPTDSLPKMLEHCCFVARLNPPVEFRPVLFEATARVLHLVIKQTSDAAMDVQTINLLACAASTIRYFYSWPTELPQVVLFCFHLGLKRSAGV